MPDRAVSGCWLRFTGNICSYEKLRFLLLLLPLVLGSCDDDESRVETWTVASEKGVAGIFMGFGHVPAYIVKTAPDAEWRTFSGSIANFTFEKGTRPKCWSASTPSPILRPTAPNAATRWNG